MVMKLWIILILTVTLLCSCESDAEYNYIDTAEMKTISIHNGPFYGKIYDALPSYAEDLLAAIDKAITERSTEPVDDTLDLNEYEFTDENLLNLQIAREDNSLSMIDVFIISDEEGILSITEQSADETQTRIANFKFTDAALIEEAKSVLTALEAEYDAQS